MPDKKKEPAKPIHDIKKGAFHKWLGKAQGESITDADIEKGLKSNDAHVKKMAQFAKNARKFKHDGKKVAKESISELNSLRIETARVSLESISGADVRDLLSNTFPSIVANVKGFFGKFVPGESGIVLGFNEAAFIKEIIKRPYLDISPLAAFVPEGMDTTYLKYSESLLLSTTHAANILSGVMTGYTTFLGQLISNTDSKLASVRLMTHEGLEDNRKKLNEELGKCFKHGSTKTEVTLGDVVDRNSDWEHVLRTSDVMFKLINSVDRKALNKKIDECASMLDIVLAKIKRDEFVGMSPETIENLSNGAYRVASELEYFSVTYYNVLAFSIALTHTAEHFNKVFDKEFGK